MTIENYINEKYPNIYNIQLLQKRETYYLLIGINETGLVNIHISINDFNNWLIDKRNKIIDKLL